MLHYLLLSVTRSFVLIGDTIPGLLENRTRIQLPSPHGPVVPPRFAVSEAHLCACFLPCLLLCEQSPLTLFLMADLKLVTFLNSFTVSTELLVDANWRHLRITHSS